MYMHMYMCMYMRMRMHRRVHMFICIFLTPQAVNIAVKKTIFNELDIAFHVRESQLWRHVITHAIDSALIGRT